MTLTGIVTCVACVLLCARLIGFRRRARRYRWGVSLLAWLLTASSGTVALDLLMHPAQHITWGQAGMSAVLCLLAFLARGNVAHIVRTHHDPHAQTR